MNGNEWDDLLAKAMRCWTNLELKAEPLEQLVNTATNALSQVEGEVDELLELHNVSWETDKCSSFILMSVL